MGKFNIKKATTRTTNLAGGAAYKFDVRTELVHAVLTTFLDDKYYESGSGRQDRIVDLIKKNKPEFVAKLAYVARTEYNLRSVSTLLLGELSKVHKGDDLVKRAIVASTTRVDDLTELLALVGTPIPKQIKRGVRNALYKFGRYALAKYKGEGKAVSLVDLFNLVHPKVQHANEEQKLAWKDLMEGNLKSFDTWEVELAGAKNDEERKEKLSNLVLTNKIGYMALLRNLNNIIKYGCSSEVIKHAAERLSDKEEVAKSKQLPFRFVTAYENVGGNRILIDAITQAMEHAVSNVPDLPGTTLIAVDSSGSMSGDPIGKASIFAAALAKRSNSDVVLYDTNIKSLKVSSSSAVMDIANSIKGAAMGGGTYTGIVFDNAKQVYDRIIILSDNESWSGSAQSAYAAYKSRLSCDPFVYAIDIAGYGTTDLSSPKVKNLVGWSERLLDFIGESEKINIVDYIEGKTL